MITNFGIGLVTPPSFAPQLVYSQNLDFVPSPDDTLPSVIPGINSLPTQSDGCERVRIMVFGSSYGVTYTIRWLYRLQFAHISEWSFLMPAPSEGEFMSIITKRIPLSPTN
ncbi:MULTISPECIES: peptide ABC transporter substrate-binding protein [unclassified Microcoleus]|uniref:peptide ABC transporter substrate-binding protein n=1 Tax=unclassified Microcoleus TaxID=2642155 RepID=UPI0025CDCA20|nr:MULTISPECIES: peptide ABC transporter substrate-binding protein [unclassified Microcoleus]